MKKKHHMPKDVEVIAKKIDHQLNNKQPVRISESEKRKMGDYLLTLNNSFSGKFTSMYQGRYFGAVKDFKKLFNKSLDSYEFFKISQGIAERTHELHMHIMEKENGPYKRTDITSFIILRAAFIYMEQSEKITDEACLVRVSRGHGLNYEVFELPSYPVDNFVDPNKIKILYDPMIGSGGTHCKTIDLLKSKGIPEENISIVGFNGSPYSILRLLWRYPSLGNITIAYLSTDLNDEFYIEDGPEKEAIGDQGERNQEAIEKHGEGLIGKKRVEKYSRAHKEAGCGDLVLMQS